MGRGDAIGAAPAQLPFKSRVVNRFSRQRLAKIKDCFQRVAAQGTGGETDRAAGRKKMERTNGFLRHAAVERINHGKRYVLIIEIVRAFKPLKRCV